METYRAFFSHPSLRQKEYKWFVLVIREEVGRGRWRGGGGGKSTEDCWWCRGEAYRGRFSP